MEIFLIITGAVMVIAAGVVARIIAQRRRQRRQHEAVAEARQLFRRRREWLEAAFVTHASAHSKPRDLVWADCEFEDAVAFARDRDSGQLRAFVGVTISFEAEEGGGMEDVEAVCALRAATAVFHYGDGTWSTDGRAIFNLSPQQTIDRYQRELEILE